MRQFCVEIAPPFIRRNIDAALLREHSARRICAHYKGLQICAKKITNYIRMRKKKILKPGFEPGIFNFKAATLTTQPPSSRYVTR